MSARILIVEDEAVTALDLKQQLISMGHDVVGIANDAAGAVKAAAELKPCLASRDTRQQTKMRTFVNRTVMSSAPAPARSVSKQDRASVSWRRAHLLLTN